jgi:Xaa-Pro aminopeptidase
LIKTGKVSERNLKTGEMNNHKARLVQLRALMKANDIDAYLIPNTDPHLGEYIPGHWKIVQWLTGFTGSSATVIVAKKFAGLWTDSRYFLQAEEQLSGSGFSMKKLNDPSEHSWVEWLAEKMKKGSRIGVDGRIFSIGSMENLKKLLEGKKVEIDSECDLISEIWTGRAPMPSSVAFDHGIGFSGKERSEKIREVREQMLKTKIDSHLLTSVDDIMWMLNIRGNDMEFSPLIISYAIVGHEQIILFTDERKIPLKLAMEFDKIGITILPYEEISLILSRLKKGTSLLLTPEKTNTFLFSSIPDEVNIVNDISIPTRIKATKNKIEIQNIRRVMVKDGVALTKFLFWLEKNIGINPITESSAAEKLLEFRLMQADCTGESFSTIAAYKAHGALAHYSPSKGSDSLLNAEGIFLIDSGGQYLDGTTDITRTISLGTPDKRQKSDFTLVLKGFINLAKAKFPSGTRGFQLDILARKSLWDNGLNYAHGTGHGVGFFLNVHEGPHSIGTGATGNRHFPLEAGLVLSDEPAIYREGQYGIRTENLLLVTEDEKSEFGQFLKFETLSLCYIDKALIDSSLLDKDEIGWLNIYHSDVYKKLSALLTDDEKVWLREKTEEI